MNSTKTNNNIDQVLYQLKTKDDKIFDTTEERIKSADETGMSVIPIITNNDLKDERQLKTSDLQRIAHPKLLTADQEDFFHTHDKLKHQHHKKMKRSCKNVCCIQFF